MTDIHPTSRLTNLTAAFALAATDDMLSALTRRGTSVAKRILAVRAGAISLPLAALTAQERTVLEKILDKMLYAMTSGRERCDHICRLCDIDACRQDICPVETAAVRTSQSSRTAPMPCNAGSQNDRR